MRIRRTNEGYDKKKISLHHKLIVLSKLFILSFRFDGPKMKEFDE